MPLFRVVVAVAVAVLAVPAAAFDRLVVFGDSFSDVGNVYAATNGVTPASPPNFQGRFSNGPVWAEQAAGRLGLPVLAPSLLGGSGFAFGGALVLGDRPDPFGGGQLIPGVASQVDMYLAAGGPRQGDLVAFFAGANDLGANFSPPSAIAAGVDQQLRRLLNAGANDVAVVGLPALGAAPLLNDTPQLTALANGLAASTNNAMDAALTGVRADYPAATVYPLVDLFTFTQDVLADPAAYGFVNVTDPALSPTGQVVPNPREYLFWDDLHPTTAGHAYIAEAFVAVVPEPALLWCGAVMMLMYRKAHR